jgi:predicted nucleotidyltransferase
MINPLDYLDEAVRRIVESVHPRRIILFGSAARGDGRPDSDLDLLIIMPDGADCMATAKNAYRRLYGLGCSQDLVVVPEADMVLLGDNPSLAIHTALSEGKEVYRAA